MSALSWMLFIPLFGAIIVYIFGRNRESDKSVKWLAFVISLIPLIINLYLLTKFQWSMSEMQFYEKHTWIEVFGVSYALGVDGLSMPMVLLTTILTPLTILLSFDEHNNSKTFLSLMLLMETGLTGVFISLDFFLFYLFWELTLIPMFLLIMEWGGPRRRYASLKFFIYTHIASLIMLVAIISMVFVAHGQLGYYTFDILEITSEVAFAKGFQYVIFPLLFFGFAVKMPIVPFHTWLPDAHVEAPTGGSVILAGVMLKMGCYGLIRIGFTMMPDAVIKFALPMAILGVISMVYGAFLALAQDDLKKMIAYSSVSHMGSVLLGLAVLNEYGFDGAMFQMFAHGIISAMMFMACGVLQHSVGTRKISQLGGVASRLPILSAFTVFSFLASLGLPGLAGFIPELNVFLGAFDAIPALALVAMVSMIITAAYYLWALQRAYFGKYNEKLEKENPHDVRWFQAVPLGVLVVLILVFGLYPAPIMDMIHTSSSYILSIIGGVL
jgi:proton-translocating NADH-quinone oxidoreductase chain M